MAQVVFYASFARLPPRPLSASSAKSQASQADCGGHKQFPSEAPHGQMEICSTAN